MSVFPSSDKMIDMFTNAIVHESNTGVNYFFNSFFVNLAEVTVKKSVNEFNSVLFRVSESDFNQMKHLEERAFDFFSPKISDLILTQPEEPLNEDFERTSCLFHSSGVFSSSAYLRAKIQQEGAYITLCSLNGKFEVKMENVFKMNNKGSLRLKINGFYKANKRCGLIVRIDNAHLTMSDDTSSSVDSRKVVDVEETKRKRMQDFMTSVRGSLSEKSEENSSKKMKK